MASEGGMRKETKVSGGFRPHAKLEVYRIAHHLALKVHRLTLRLSRYQEYEEGSQIRRSSKSVSSQIVEGHALRRYKAEYIRYLVRAYGSAEETIEHLPYLGETAESEIAADATSSSKNTRRYVESSTTTHSA